MDAMKTIETHRKFMQSNFDDWEDIVSDQEKKMPYPALEKPVPEGAELIDLPSIDLLKELDGIKDKGLTDALLDRVSHRKYDGGGLSLEELGYLLYCTQGVRKFKEGKFSMRTVPSGGARHPFETYLVVRDVESLDQGLYRYLPFSNQLFLVDTSKSLSAEIVEATFEQKFAGQAAVTFVWASIPYRCEWRYSISAHKTMLLDAGHICQNLYVACEAIGAGTCGIAAYDQKLMDALVQIDGVDEFVVYLAPVGKVGE